LLTILFDFTFVLSGGLISGGFLSGWFISGGFISHFRFLALIADQLSHFFFCEVKFITLFLFEVLFKSDNLFNIGNGYIFG
jgi:hypothetical protein